MIDERIGNDVYRKQFSFSILMHHILAVDLMIIDDFFKVLFKWVFGAAKVMNGFSKKLLFGIAIQVYGCLIHVYNLQIGNTEDPHGLRVFIKQKQRYIQRILHTTIYQTVRINTCKQTANKICNRFIE